MAAGITICLRFSLGIVALLAVIHVGYVSLDISHSSDIGLKLSRQQPNETAAGGGAARSPTSLSGDLTPSTRRRAASPRRGTAIPWQHSGSLSPAEASPTPGRLVHCLNCTHASPAALRTAPGSWAAAAEGGGAPHDGKDGSQRRVEKGGGSSWPGFPRHSQPPAAIHTSEAAVSATASLAAPRGSVAALGSSITGAKLERQSAHMTKPGGQGGDKAGSMGIRTASSSSLVHASTTTRVLVAPARPSAAVSTQAEPLPRRLTKWPKGDINKHKLPTILILGCVKKGCKPKKVSCLEDVTDKRLGNTMVSVINSIWLADALQVSIKVSGLNKPGIVNLPERVGPKDKSCPRKTLPQNEIKLLFWPWHRSANKVLCQNCIVPSPGAGWEAGLKARRYIDLDDSPAVPNSTLVIHMRGEDIFDPSLKKQHPWFVQPPCSWYPFIIRKHGYRMVLIVSSDDGNNPCIALIKELCKQDNVEIKFSSGSIRDDYSTISRASHLAIGFSTYAMTAAFVSPNLQRLHFPMYEKSGKYHSLPIYLGYGGRGIRLTSYLISNYITTWTVGSFGIVTKHPAKFIKQYKEFEV